MDEEKKKIWILIVAIAIMAALLAGYITLAVFFFYIPRFVVDFGKYDISEKPIEDEITVMSINVRGYTSADKFRKSWFYRAKLQRYLIEEAEPDIIGFQEATNPTIWYNERHLVGYTFVEKQMNFEDNDSNLFLAYRTDRFEKQEEGYFWLSETPDTPSKSWDTACVRYAAYVKLKDNRTGKTLVVLDTHLDHVSSAARANGMQVILDKTEHLNADNLIIMGDMNSSYGGAAYKKAISAGLLDASEVAAKTYHGKGSTYHNWGEYLDGVPIDFFFVSPAITVNEYYVFDKTFDGVYPSDHFPIVMKIEL
ncbi:MAG: endonuclease/exonuclease/phosphatase family protein [Clostridia bacterium]|nr:endonuclease/exonuclease/phosphatase family protein [Clostridia bacterium]